MEANLLPANAEPSQLTADEMDLVSGGMVIIMPWVRIAITGCGWEADIGRMRINSDSEPETEHDIDSPIPR